MISAITWLSLAASASVSCSNQPASVSATLLETRTIELTQTVTLHDVATDAKQVRMWVPIPGDAQWQRVLDWRVESAPGKWRVVPQAEGRGNFVYVEMEAPGKSNLSVVIRSTIERQGVHVPVEKVAAAGGLQSTLFETSLRPDAPLMEVDERIASMAERICGQERDPGKQALLLLKAVADEADHYSKDPTKPTCGRGAAEDCLEHGGGCCTDLHSLFIALARARGIPARIEFGYRALDAKAGTEYDPGYRCWVEYFIPGAGWVPTDIVAADNADVSNPFRWNSLSASKVWLWHGRSFELTPPAAAGRIDTMLCGWAEIDGKSVDVLPAADGTPSKLRRTIKFTVIDSSPMNDAAAATVRPPQ